MSKPAFYYVSVSRSLKHKHYIFAWLIVYYFIYICMITWKVGFNFVSFYGGSHPQTQKHLCISLLKGRRNVEVLSLNVSSVLYLVTQVCRVCGLLGYYNHKLKAGICSTCKNGDNISSMKLPYACKLLIQVKLFTYCFPNILALLMTINLFLGMLTRMAE